MEGAMFSCAQVRSRAEWIEKGEKSTKYFLGLEQSNGKKNAIDSLLIDGKEVHTTNDVLKECVRFYKCLYTTRDIEEGEINEYLNSTILDSIVSNEDKILCEKELTLEELYLTAKSMKTNKAPGPDGLPVEFYLTFWNYIAKPMHDSFAESFIKGELSATQKRAIIRLIYKKDDKKLLKNWRPISLLNTDYKILTSALAKRLQHILPKIINSDQSAYIKGRFIGQNIRLVNDIIELSQDQNTSGAILFLDFEKAFDSLERNFMFAVLEKFNFGSNFVNMIKCIYRRCFSCVTNKGWNSEYFNISRGIRQGCALSALLFVISVESLACNIRHNKNIQGFQLSEDKIPFNLIDFVTEIKISQVADDTTIFTKDANSTLEAIREVNRFSEVSGLKLNMTKTEGILLKEDPVQTEMVQIKWTSGPVKSLGIYFGLDKLEIQKLNWESKLDKLRRLLSVWRKRDLTLYGKSVVLKSLALSKLYYNMNVIVTPDYNYNKES